MSEDFDEEGSPRNFGVQVRNTWVRGFQHIYSLAETNDQAKSFKEKYDGQAGHVLGNIGCLTLSEEADNPERLLATLTRKCEDLEEIQERQEFQERRLGLFKGLRELTEKLIEGSSLTPEDSAQIILSHAK